MITAERYHDISCGHRVAGHESKCAFLHGHNYRIHFVCRGDLDSVGRVIDFSVIKSRLCMWLEENWDHKFLAWEKDEVMRDLLVHCQYLDTEKVMLASLVWLPFNPTAENIAMHLLRVVAPEQLKGTGVEVVNVRVEETRKCSAEANFQVEQSILEHIIS